MDLMIKVSIQIEALGSTQLKACFCGKRKSITNWIEVDLCGKDLVFAD